MRLLVMGGAGFIGSEVTRFAIVNGHYVLNIDKLTYAANLAALDSVVALQNYGFLRARHSGQRID